MLKMSIAINSFSLAFTLKANVNAIATFLWESFEVYLSFYRTVYCYLKSHRMIIMKLTKIEHVIYIFFTSLMSIFICL